MAKMIRVLIFIFLLLLTQLLTACVPSVPAGIIEPSPDLLPTSTPSPLPTATNAPTVTPTPSPPSGQIVFVSNRDGENEIYTLQLAGGQPVNLSQHFAVDEMPSCAIRGGQIAYLSWREETVDIYLLPAGGLPALAVNLSLKINPVMAMHPALSPDGLRLAFAGEIMWGNNEIYLANVDGSGLTRLTDNPTADASPTWSPGDGSAQQIAFTRINEELKDTEIYLMNADGSNLHRLEGAPVGAQLPAWSPDGKKIAFQWPQDGNFDIYTIGLDGSGLARLTNHPAEDMFPAWSPDGSYLVFASSRDGNSEIYLISATCNDPENGCEQNLTRLTDSPAEDSDPCWLP